MKTFKEIRETVSLDEAKTIKIVADTNSRKYKEGEVIKTFPETDKGLNQAMAFQKTVKDKFGVETKMIRESSDLDEASSKQVHVRMDNLGKDQKKVGDILRKYEKNGSIEFDGETDKGAIFTVKKPAAIATLNRELKPYYTSAELDEAVDNDDKGEYDNEGEMAKTQLRGVVADASHMIKMFSDDQNLPEWVQAKITKAADYLKSAHSYMMNKDEKSDVKEVTFHTGIGSGGDEVMKQLLKRLKKSGGAPDLQKDLERRLNNKGKGK